jgi:hypothetical protein
VGFVDVHLRDHTPADEPAIIARPRAGRGADLPVGINDQTPRALRGVEAVSHHQADQAEHRERRGPHHLIEVIGHG